MAATNNISDGLQTDINEIMNWSADNKMILNESKTKSLLVTGKRLGKKHVENLCTKLSQRISVLRKIRRSLPLDQMLKRSLGELADHFNTRCLVAFLLFQQLVVFGTIHNVFLLLLFTATTTASTTGTLP